MKNGKPKTGAVIVGAGSSRRLGRDKVFLPLAGKSLLAWSVDTCLNSKLLDDIVVVLSSEKLNEGRRLAAENSWSVKMCTGGQRRQDSVRQGLKQLRGCDVVIIHDCARPFLSYDLIHDGLIAVEKTGAAVAAVPIRDTVKAVDDDMTVSRTLNREELWSVQTPQVFRFDIIAKAHERIKDDVTDDASMVERLGFKVKIYMGSYNNIKITTMDDLALAELIAGAK